MSFPYCSDFLLLYLLSRFFLGLFARALFRSWTCLLDTCMYDWLACSAFGAWLRGDQAKSSTWEDSFNWASEWSNWHVNLTKVRLCSPASRFDGDYWQRRKNERRKGRRSEREGEKDGRTSATDSATRYGTLLRIPVRTRKLLKGQLAEWIDRSSRVFSPGFPVTRWVHRSTLHRPYYWTRIGTDSTVFYPLPDCVALYRTKRVNGLIYGECAPSMANDLETFEKIVAKFAGHCVSGKENQLKAIRCLTIGFSL